MVNKIDFYREVLEIEPNSKIFFPLARKLAEQGQTDEAAAVLAKGITFHPDHLEAKFFLIELLTGLDRQGEADAVFADVGKMLSNYPSVWLLWSREAAARAKDPSLAMLFLANYFQNQTLTWSEVMERGLKSLRRSAPGAAPGHTPDDAAASEPPAAMPEPAPVAPSREAVALKEPEPASPAAARAPAEAGGEAPQLRGAREVMELAEILEPPAETGDKGKARSGKGRDTAVRTKTMAAVLAEQGDTSGALGIYEELLRCAPSETERQDIEARMAALAPGKGGATSDAPAVADVADDTAGKPKSAAKLVSFLEALAGRLDARAES
ncbi:tetratricopeptide repeat protein [Solidesulfovibrio sp. C21]|uniref:tetratricopeptide repeat protein n=1 Tax=Solidesulfovibrio sp. C21 TaxID=3398613 RepID=UPI0039FC00B3